jgi:hypothetical protein
VRTISTVKVSSVLTRAYGLRLNLFCPTVGGSDQSHRRRRRVVRSLLQAKSQSLPAVPRYRIGTSSGHRDALIGESLRWSRRSGHFQYHPPVNLPAILPITWRPRKSANTTQRRQLLSRSRTPLRWHYVVDQDRDRELPAIFPHPSFLWPIYQAVDSPHNPPHSSDNSRPKALVGRNSVRASVR